MVSRISETRFAIKDLKRWVSFEIYCTVDNFKNDLSSHLSNEEESKSSFGVFQKTFLNVLDKHAPLKKRTVRANEAPYMTKQLRKAIMTRSRLQNRYHHLKTDESYQKFKRQRNFCNRLYKKERKKFYKNLKPNDITDNKKFWKNVKPFFSGKGVSKKEIILVEDGKIICDEENVANTLNTFFENAVTSLGIPNIDFHLTDPGDAN